MSRNYTYIPEYKENNSNITHRRCTSCKDMKKISKMENSRLCKVCYIYKYKKKRCKICRLLKETKHFTKSKRHKDGYLSNCKDCTKRKKDVEKISQYNKTYYQKKKRNL